MNIKTKTDILLHIKSMLQEIIDSPRWNDVDNPLRTKIQDIGERVKSSEDLREFREIEDLNLLIEIADSFEEYFNDDWLPDEIIGLKLMDSRKFLQKLIDEYDKIFDGQ